MNYTVESYINFCDNVQIANEAISDKINNVWERFKNVLTILSHKVTALVDKIKEAMNKNKKFTIQKVYKPVYLKYMTLANNIYTASYGDESTYERLVKDYKSIKSLIGTADDLAEANKHNITEITTTPFGLSSNISKQIARCIGDINRLMKKPDVNSAEIEKIKLHISYLKFAYRVCYEAYNFLLSHSTVSRVQKEKTGTVTTLKRPIGATPEMI